MHASGHVQFLSVNGENPLPRPHGIRIVASLGENTVTLRH